MTQINQGIIMKALDYCYDKAVNGLPGLATAEDMANDYSGADRPMSDNARSLVRWQVAKSSTSGFITGLGGIITLPVAIPANITSVLYVQTRMIAAIAIMGKYDIRNDKVKTLVYMCLCGTAMMDTVKGVGIQIGSKLTVKAINSISRATINKINQAVGFRLVTKFGQTGVVNLSKAVPFLGGVIGGTVDGVATKSIGTVAIKTFL